MPLMSPWVYLAMWVIIVVHRVHRWVGLLMTLPSHPSTLHNTFQYREGQPVGWKLTWLGCVLWPVCMVSSAIGSYHRVLVSHQEQCQYPVLLGGAGSGVLLITNSGEDILCLALSFLFGNELLQNEQLTKPHFRCAVSCINVHGSVFFLVLKTLFG